MNKNLEHAQTNDTSRRLARVKEFKFRKAYEFLNHWFKFSSTISLFDMVFMNGIRVIGGGNKAAIPNNFQPSDLVKILDEQFKQYEVSASQILRYELEPS